MKRRNLPNARKAYKELNSRTEQYVSLIDGVFDTYNKEVAAIALRTSYDGNKPFSFSDYPETKATVKKLRNAFYVAMGTIFVKAITTEWQNSNKFNDDLVKSALMYYGVNAADKAYQKYFNYNNAALKAFINRKDKGLNLSAKIWNQSGDYLRELEYAISAGIENGLSAAQIAGRIKKYLNEPDKLFRRVRDKYGVLQLSKAARAYHPGQGVYRSSYKNALRLARTEINMAYRTADNERWQQLDFVVGFEIKRSGRHYDCPVCESLAGKYPKDFLFVGWHPNCRCYQISLLKTDEEYWNDSETSVNEVKDVPDNFKKWIADNADRIKDAEQRNTLPYFLKDNGDFWEEELK